MKTEEDATTLARRIQPYIDRGEIAGSVMFVANRDETLAVEATGWADIERRKPMAADSIFWVASQTKPVTAVAIMMLADEGKLSVSDLVEKYLPDFAKVMVVAKREEGEVLLRKPGRPITIEDLLMHTSGLPFKTLVEEPTLDLLPLATGARSYAMAPLEFEPGSATLYSNAGFNTAGRIVEVVTGRLYEEFLDERLFNPLGMRDTTFWPVGEQIERLAESYKADPSDGRLVKVQIEQLDYPLSDLTKRFPMPAGGLFSTARDLVIFYRMMLNEGTLDGREYLKPETVREMTRRRTPESWDRAQGLGFMGDGKTFSHGGAYGTHTLAEPESGLILGWLAQRADAGGAWEEARKEFEKGARERFGPGTPIS